MTRRDTIIAELERELAFYRDRNKLHKRNLILCRRSSQQFLDEERATLYENIRRMNIANIRLNRLMGY